MSRMFACVMLGVLFVAVACKGDSKKKAEPAKTVERAPVAKEPPPPPPPPPLDPKLLARGRYLADLGGCMLCHTGFGPQGPDLPKAWAGGLEIPEKFGTWRSPNITQDKKTGIGDWTDEQIIAAVREGKRPDGSQMYPIMPYLFFNTLANDDAQALVVFLRTIAPIENAVAGNTDLQLPKVPAPPPSGQAPPADDPVAQGAYLATLMHCVFCHTPFDETGMPDMKNKAFAGGFEFDMPPMFGTGKLYSSNITSDRKTGIGKWTDEQIIAAVTAMKRPDGKPIMGPMMMYAMGWSKMPPEDGQALAAFVKSIPPIANKVPKSTFKPAGPPPGMGPPPGAEPPAEATPQ
jgi:hypothetical protein